ncbi:MAG: hypothetical protein ACI379_00460 [Nocardioides sp.]|uniref:hypothetical protein n=1 Tax=Nocardioides sp. TaxID=35761 RepID=UPI003F0FDE60
MSARSTTSRSWARVRAAVCGAAALTLGVLGGTGVALVPAAHADNPTTTITQTDDTGRTVTLTFPTGVEAGSEIVLQGTGWQVTNGSSGSVVNVFLDASFSGDPATVYTKRDVIDPLTGKVTGDKRSQALVEADASGRWTARIPYPTAANARLSDGSWQEWVNGSEHKVRVLTGSLKPGDVTRSLNGAFTVSGGAEVGEQDPPAWTHTTLRAGTTTAWVERDLAAGDGARLRIKGTGWTTTGGVGSTVAVKLGNSSSGGQYRRTGSDVIAHPSASGDDTIWALLTPQPGTHPHQYEISPRGTFDISLDLPTLTAGQYLTVSLQSGRFASGDVQRSLTTKPLTVGGVPWTGEDDDDSDVVCTPTSDRPTVAIETPVVEKGGELVITGAGWCHPEGGGSRIAVKLDEGAYSRLDGSVHDNRSIWAVFQAEAADGTFRTAITLPDGTTRTSTPAFPTGAHTLRLLSGSLRSGDTVRSVASGTFSIGRYKPQGTPDPLDADRVLRPATRHDLSVQRQGDRLDLVVPRANDHEWVFVSVYTEDGSPRYPWSRWFKVDGRGHLRLTGADELPAGRLKVVVQSGDQTRTGRLLGWDDLRVASTDDDSQTTTTPVVVDPVSEVPADVPVTPAAPAASAEELRALPDGGITAQQKGRTVTLSIPGAVAGDLVHLYVHPTAEGAEALAGGWLVVDEGGTVTVRLRGGDGSPVLLSLQDAGGDLLGWVEVTPSSGPALVEQTLSSAVSAAPVVTDVRETVAGRSWITPLDGALLGTGLVLVLLAGLWARRNGVTA